MNNQNHLRIEFEEVGELMEIFERKSVGFGGDGLKVLALCLVCSELLELIERDCWPFVEDADNSLGELKKWAKSIASDVWKAGNQALKDSRNN